MTRWITRKKLAAILAVLFAGYLLAYVVLRNDEIVRWENRGQSSGQSVQAHYEPWDDLFVHMTRESSKAHWLWPAAVAFRDRYKVWNILFFPLCRAEEFFWNARGPD